MKAVPLQNFPLGPSFSQLSRKHVCWKGCPSEQSQSGTWQTGSCSITPSMVLQDSGCSHESCWHPSRKAGVCSITDRRFCSWQPPIALPSFLLLSWLLHREAHGLPSVKWKWRSASLLTRNGVWRKNYRDQAKSLKLCTVATAEICRDSACNAVCAPHIKTKQKIPWLKKNTLLCTLFAPTGKHKVCKLCSLAVKRVISDLWDSKTSSSCPCLCYFTQQ